MSTTASSSRLTPQMSRCLDEDQAIKENVSVAVRLRPLSPREIRQGEEVAWYADGETVVRSGQNPSIYYTYDRVFAPTTTTLKVYEAAAQDVVRGAMEGIHGAVFSYGVTSSGKTHTMHGNQRSPGIIPLAVKDAFTIIQEMPNREFLLRASYLEIFDEVVSDLLNPAMQNLWIRNDPQGTFVEGIKEEVVLSPAHALSLIAAGEEHRHDGSTNLNIQSSRSHTIFTLTIESNSCGESNEGEAVTFSQLHLIDLASPVNSMARTSGVLHKEGSYFNKSIVTLETVISKLTDGKAMHIPFQDSKLTQFLQSSLSGQGRISLICTVTPASSNSEETHSTLKIAQLAKHIEVQASRNKIIDEKSLMKKYQNEIHRLKEVIELSLEDQDEAKSALLARIQYLTKLILASTNANHTSSSPNPGLRRDFEEVELAYLRYTRQDIMSESDLSEILALGESFGASLEECSKNKRNRRRISSWFKFLKRDGRASTLRSSDREKSNLTKSAAPSTPIASVSDNILSIGYGQFLSDDLPEGETSLVSTKTILTEEASRNPNSEKIQVSTKAILTEEASRNPNSEKIQVSTKTILTEEASRNPNSEKIQVNAADNREIQDQLQEKTSECMEEQLSQGLQAKDSLSNVMQNSSGVNNGAQLQSDREKTIPREISAETLRNNQLVPPYDDELIELMQVIQNQMAYFVEVLSDRR